MQKTALKGQGQTKGKGKGNEPKSDNDDNDDEKCITLSRQDKNSPRENAEAQGGLFCLGLGISEPLAELKGEIHGLTIWNDLFGGDNKDFATRIKTLMEQAHKIYFHLRGINPNLAYEKTQNTNRDDGWQPDPENVTFPSERGIITHYEYCLVAKYYNNKAKPKHIDQMVKGAPAPWSRGKNCK